MDEASAGQGARRVEGRVTAQLPSGLYQVDVEGTRMTAHLGSGLDRNFVRVLVGDRVDRGADAAGSDARANRQEDAVDTHARSAREGVET